MEGWQRRSLLEGFQKYKKPIFGLGMLVSVIGTVSLISNLLSADMSTILAAILESYERFFRDPVAALLANFGLSTPAWVIDLGLVYGVFGTSLARTKASLRETFRQSVLSGRDYIVNGRRRIRETNTSWFSVLYLVKPLDPTHNGKSRTLLIWLANSMRRRIRLFYDTSPEPLKATLDVVFFPVAMLTFFTRPILAYEENFQNPEDCWYTMVAEKEMNAHNAHMMSAWMTYRPRVDFRWFFIGQLSVVVGLTGLVFIVNSALA